VLTLNGKSTPQNKMPAGLEAGQSCIETGLTILLLSILSLSEP
jgi:hypothetical protein